MLSIFCIHAAIGILQNLFGKARRDNHALPNLYSPFSVPGIYGFRTEHEFGITELAHLRNIETCQLCFCRNTLSHEVLEERG